MADRPLLLFPEPEVASRTNLHGGPGRIHFPARDRQGGRISPVLNQLQTAFENRRAEILQSAVGIDPEQVLVIETIGSVEAFANAVRRIEGMEWMGEFEIEDIAPDDDFYDENHPDKQLSGRLYLLMTNLRALEQMLSLWRTYQSNPNMVFQRGLTKFRDVFLCLKNIRRWDIQDRFLETGTIDAWREDLAYNQNRVVRFETELWFRGSPEQRQSGQRQVEAILQRCGGRLVGQCVIDAIKYHALLAELPANEIRQIIEHPATELTRCDDIMFFRPVGQMTAGCKKQCEGNIEGSESQPKPLPSGSPVIAVLDGLPLSNHEMLAGRLIIDDPDNWASDYPAFDRRHGTAIASLITHGDLTENNPPLRTPLYVRPITRPAQWPYSPRPEVMPDNLLPVDLIHRAIKRIFEGENGDSPTAPTTKIINFAIGDPSRQFTSAMSPLARLLDWLSVKYNILIIVSAGNHNGEINLGILREEFANIAPAELQSLTIQSIYQDTRNRRLLSPAESINCISAGAIHHDISTVANLGDRINVYQDSLPSPVSAFGNGYRRAIKPDLVYPAGRQLYRCCYEQTSTTKIEPAIFQSAPGNKVAVPSNVAGETSSCAYCCGTSNAAALISRAAANCYESLMDIFAAQMVPVDRSKFATPLIKAMLVHGCQWGNLGTRLEDILRNSDYGHQLESNVADLYTRDADITREINRKFSSLVGRWIGFGVPEINRVLECSAQRASILGFGELSDSQAHIFKLPLPPSLGSRREWRRLTVTLAWLSPTVPSMQKYRGASLWFELLDNSLAQSRTDTDHNSVRRGTVQHEIFEGDRATPFGDGDSLRIKVNCREDAGKLTEPVSYGLAVSLEVAEGVSISIYDEIKTRIITPIQIQTGEITP